jgi:hypothetical protein
VSVREDAPCNNAKRNKLATEKELLVEWRSMSCKAKLAYLQEIRIAVDKRADWKIKKVMHLICYE